MIMNLCLETTDKTQLWFYFQDSAQINGFDFKEELEPPRLPEEGLKTRQDAESIYLDFICKRDSKEM